VNRVFQVYLNGLAYHDASSFLSAVCPRLRPGFGGFALHGYYVGPWIMLPYDIPATKDNVIVQARLTQIDPNTGREAGQVTYSWNVERDGSDYYVCGWFG
jgi:hypothetical protein